MKTVTDRRKLHALRRWACVCLVGGGWTSMPLAQPAPPSPALASPPAESWETQSVRELMQQDLREALRDSPPGSAGRPPDRAARAPLAPRLVALYGVGRVLMAEVQVGRRAYLYVRGQAFPAGHAGDPGVYQLRGMNGACVQLERGEDRHSLCLRMLLGGEQP
ncbi:hypothetical protein [Castellaniella sp.]|uniref:hypothetical protein n=1 Tax=Castellaniella sp. TaxID=1955812 RepID=UPI003C71E347